MRYLLTRLAYALPMLFGVSSLAFLLLNLLPNDIAQIKAGEDATPQRIAEIRAGLGLDRPVLERYWDWLSSVLRGDLGESWHNGQQVVDGILATAPVTLSMVVLSLLLSLLVGVPIGVVAAVRGGVLDRVLVSSAVVALAVPNFWLALLMVYVFALSLGIVPATGYVPLDVDPGQWVLHLVLPVIAVASVAVSAIARQTRSAMLENLDRDYVRTLRATGIGEWSVVYKHALKNAGVPILTTLGIQFVNLSGGSIIVEQVFAVPGLGQYTMTALARNDVPVVLGVLVVTAIAVVLINLVVDLLNSAVNPKVRA
ncbi:ABC transporter permease [Modestobacter sp. VKM Ac-2986]|uniref:ABC transporter permease n=1 Tax=Modestobacter sp. VKM Ac-2986 TaxID=3004140 RepID=UPI0022AA2334|nr:ABC transporter permease [Modestobacter sp. VKM Ac-2986]MCZ2827726.1 ABC transporter permease [Modestobacter sp. VKM Ac-2986]